MSIVAFATSREFADLTLDDRLVITPLSERGIRVVPTVWNNPQVPWRWFDAVVVRSCWDYEQAHHAFLRWTHFLARNHIPLWNPQKVIQDNIDKAYLRRMHADGYPVIPTRFLPRGGAVSPEAYIPFGDYDRLIVKPQVGLDGRGIEQVSAGSAEAEHCIKEHVRCADTLVQPFLPQIHTDGEWSFIFLGGQLSHVIVKRPGATDFRSQEIYGGTVEAVSPPAHLTRQATAIVNRYATGCLYARVDGIEEDGTLLLSELELTEPSLYLGHHEEAHTRFAEAIAAALRRGPTATS